MSLEKAFYLRVEKKKLDDIIKGFLHREVFSMKRQFPQFVSQFIVTDFYIYPSRYKSSKMEHILVFDFFLSFYRLMLHMSMHWVTFKTYFSHLLSFILIHLSHFIKFYLLFTNLKFKEKILVFLFRRFTLLQFRIIVDSF